MNEKLSQNNLAQSSQKHLRTKYVLVQGKIVRPYHPGRYRADHPWKHRKWRTRRDKELTGFEHRFKKDTNNNTFRNY